MLGFKSLEQLANYEQKFVQIQILDSIGYIRQCSRSCKSEYKKKEVAGLRIQSTLGSTDREDGLID